MLTTQRKLLISAVVVILTGTLWPGLYVNAANKPVRQGDSLTISPLRVEHKLERGQNVASTVKIKNSGTNRLTAKMYAELFSTTNELYDQIFTRSSDALSADKWISFSQESYSLEPNQEIKVNFQINVPQAATPGGHYVAIFAQIEPPETTATNDIVQIKRVASLIFLEISGKLDKSGRLVSVKTPFWHRKGDINVSLRLQNTGNAHFRADGWVRLRTIWGSERTKTRIDGLLLPDTTRLLEPVLPAPRWPGIYKVQAYISFPNQATTKSTWIVILPPTWLTILGILVLSAVTWQTTSRLKARRASAKTHKNKDKTDKN